MAWLLCQYKRDLEIPRARYCVIEDYYLALKADGATWGSVEVLGNHAIVKVKCSDGMLTTLRQDPLITYIPLSLLTSSLGDLTNNQINAIRTKVESLGYTTTELQQRLGNNWRTRTLGDVLRVVATRRIKPRWDRTTQAIVFDRDTVLLPTTAIDTLHDTVTD